MCVGLVGEAAMAKARALVAELSGTWGEAQPAARSHFHR
jgi:hypothetical protein